MTEESNQTLETIVSKVDYRAMEKGYVPSTFALKFINFIKLVNGEEGEENKSPLFHYRILDAVSSHPSTLIVSFRGSAKSSIISEYMFLYLATFGNMDGFGDISVVMYVGDSFENGCKNLRNNIEARYNKSAFLQKYLPKVKFTDIQLELENVDGHRFCVRMFGATSGVRGFKYDGKRPQLAVLDDLFTDKAAESNTIIKDIENVLYKAVRQALHPTHRKVIFIGTPFSKKDPLYKAAGSSGWYTEAFPICEKFPCTKEEFVGAWEDRFPYEAVKQEYELLKANGKVDAFNQELMLRILSNDDRLILDEDIIWYRRKDVLDKLYNYNIYITTDFATSETENSDFSVISVWALDYKGVFHWIDGIVQRQDMYQNVNDIFRFVELYKPLATGVEISGQQKGFVSWLKREMTIRNIYFTLASDKISGEEGLRPNTSKLTRFNIALPLFKQRKIAFPEDLRYSQTISEFIDELTSITPSGIKSLHDDCVDTVSQLSLIEYFKPSDPNDGNKSTTVTKFDDSRYFSYKEPETFENPYIV